MTLGLVLGGCVGSNVTYLSSVRYPAKRRGCEITVFPSTTPDREWEDLATVEAQCGDGRSSCIAELQRRACTLGGDTVYALKDGRQGEVNIVIGTVARYKEDGQPVSVTPAFSEAARAPSAPSVAPSVGCDPPCSPGYKCDGSQCLAVCNPACEQGEVCNRRRMCEPAASAPAAAP